MRTQLISLVAILAFGACTDHKPGVTGTTSLQIELTSPADPGTLDNRLASTVTSVSLTITALDVNGDPDPTFNNTLQVYLQYLGTLTPYLGDTPLATVPMTAGKGSLTNFKLPTVYGPTTVWLDDGDDTNATHATGISPTLWFPDPFIFNIRQPLDYPLETLTDYATGPIDNKNVAVNSSRYGANGKLVVTSVYAQGYTLADVKCSGANAGPPCTATPCTDGTTTCDCDANPTDCDQYNSIDIYSYSAPTDQQARYIVEGQVIDGFAGGVSEFDGLLEMGFPQTFAYEDAPVVDTTLEPAPILINPAPQPNTTWLSDTIRFKRSESANLEVDNAVVCNLDSDYATYKQWKLDLTGVGGNCNANNVVNVVSEGIAFDPSMFVGKAIPKLVGNERSINIGSFHVWILYPRGLSDFTVPQ